MSATKNGLHPRNPHKGAYDFERLCNANPELVPFLIKSRSGKVSLDFSSPEAVKELNRALLFAYYDIKQWDIPRNYLCPAVPGRADYIHHIADLLALENDGEIPQTGAIRLLDIGTGAGCIYPIIGRKAYGWKFIATDIDPLAIKTAKLIVQTNNSLKKALELRLQPDSRHIFSGIINEGETFDVSICNPPFYGSKEEALNEAGAKWKKLGKPQKGVLKNFGGQQRELWHPGGEVNFVETMIRESAQFPFLCKWFTTLVAKKEHLNMYYAVLKKVKATTVKTIEMHHGNKIARILAWHFRRIN